MSLTTPVGLPCSCCVRSDTLSSIPLTHASLHPLSNSTLTHPRIRPSGTFIMSEKKVTYVHIRGEDKFNPVTLALSSPVIRIRGAGLDERNVSHHCCLIILSA